MKEKIFFFFPGFVTPGGQKREKGRPSLPFRDERRTKMETFGISSTMDVLKNFTYEGIEECLCGSRRLNGRQLIHSCFFSLLRLDVQ